MHENNRKSLDLVDIQEHLPSAQDFNDCSAAVDSGSLEDLDITIDSFRVWNGSVQDIEYNVEYDANVDGGAISLDDYSDPIVIERSELEDFISETLLDAPISDLLNDLKLYPNTAKGNIKDMRVMLGWLEDAADKYIDINNALGDKDAE